MVRDLILDAQVAKPAVGEVHLDLATQRPLRADRKHVPDNEHPDHQLRIERGPADRGIVRRKLGVHPRQIQNRIDPANQMIGRNHVIEMELIEQLALIALQPPHHSQPPPAQVVRGRNQCSPKTATDFCNKICQFRTRAPHQIAMGSRSWNVVVLPTFAVIGPGSPSAERPTANKAGAEGSKPLPAAPSISYICPRRSMTNGYPSLLKYSTRTDTLRINLDAQPRDRPNITDGGQTMTKPWFVPTILALALLSGCTGLVPPTQAYDGPVRDKRELSVIKTINQFM